MNNINKPNKSSNYQNNKHINKHIKQNKQDTRTEKRKLGDLGESAACQFLMKQGYRIAGRNYLRKYGEIDIIAVKDKVYHFIEVKTVTRSDKNGRGRVIHETHNQDMYRPEDNIHTWKLERLARTIQAYILDKKLFDADWIFDVITVYLGQKKEIMAINMLENVVL